MTTFWSLFIAIISIGSLLGCAALLIFCSKKIKDIPDGALSEHEVDGIQEYNNPLPKWWSYLFWATLFFALFYLFAYGLGGYSGFLGWQSSEQKVKNSNDFAAQFDAGGLNQYAREMEKADKIFGERLKALTHKESAETPLPIEKIAQNPEAVKAGQRLFLQNCAQCHGSDARGQLGFPNLTDKDWQWGGSPEQIKHSIVQGRVAMMTAWIDTLGKEGVEEVVSYTLSLSGRKANILEIEKGKAHFVVCSACHGIDGKGNTALGAPNLTDNIWLYGGSRKSLIQTVTYGRNGVMPAWGNILTQEKIDLLSAYVWSLSNIE